MTGGCRIRGRLTAVALGAAAISAAAFAQTAATSRPASAGRTEAQPAGEWHNYAADSRSSKYSPLDQIDKTNVHQLEIAWRWKSIDYGLAAQHEGIFPPFLFQNTPMMRDGRVLVATGIGAAALDADTGARDPEFGDGGRIDMLDAGQGVRRRQYFWTSAPVVCGDVIVLGESTSDAWSRRNNPPGMIRGYDARSGALRWRFNIIPAPGEFGHDTWDSPEAAQAVHHGLWDFDFPAAPVLADIVVDGKAIRALAQPSKQAFLYVFDRETGDPAWPIVELPVPPSEVPGEQAWPTQPHPTWPLPYDLQGLAIDDLIDFTPELRAMALEYVSEYRIGPIFQPPTLIEGENAKPTIQVPGAVGGTNWNGAALDPETNVLYLPSVTVPAVLGLRPPPDPARSNLRYRVDLSEADGYEWATLPNGLPITKPPYGRLTAIDLDTGEHLWMVPNGDGPRDHPALAHLDLPPLGQQGRVSALVTKTLVFLADGSDAMVVQPEGAGSRKFRAYNKTNGEAVWELDLPAGVSGAPMTYLHEGRQYIVMAISGVGFEGELLALALPEAPAAAAP